MKKLQIHSLPLEEVMADIAKGLNTSYVNDCGEYTVLLPDEWGSGIIKAINFNGGLGILIYACTFNCDIEMCFSVNLTHPLKFLFCLEGSISHFFEQDEQRHSLQKYQNIIVASQGHNGHVLHFKKNTFTEIYSLEVDREIFKEKMSCELKKTKPALRSIFNDQKAKQSFYYNGLYSLVLGEIFDEMKSQHHEHLIKKIWLESQSYRMLAQQLIQYNDDLEGNSEKKILRKSEADAIKEAVEIMKLELDTINSLNSIAQRVGLSSKKFQNGFRHFYNKSANEYLQYLRLTLAKNLLINTQESLQEIKDKVGFSSQSYFSELFKKMYHTTPSNFRKEFRNK
ncbi:helix-turn-helix protein [Algoriphagus ratkowskyi]|uniref:Helix-turn-helix protein n=1 Tax=Algoriphagus ratkowskyi TaxID=57028 RepID=A0A2W7RX63_9BACT|nr:AraC family transcriptional regulator [Algoriphagus ratkowskyi]PZX55515.1 helix-turn-helix protein [Algoriphagus ratkowskyi]TXD79572.1 helix-turn-helix transcriptional regulator [Algoriphagus ratkowskyi]